MRMSKLLWTVVPILLVSCSTDRSSYEAVIYTSAAELYAAYDANELDADARFKGRLLRVSGTVTSIGKEILGAPYLTLGVGEQMAHVQCVFSRQDTASLAALRKGMKVTITCKCAGKLLNVILKDCTW